MTTTRDRILVDDDAHTYEVISVEGMPGVYSVLTFDGDKRIGRIIGGFECAPTDITTLEEEALLVIQESTAQ